MAHVGGSGFVEGQLVDHPMFMADVFNVGLVNGNYSTLNANTIVDLIAETLSFATHPVNARWGVRNDAMISNDVLMPTMGGVGRVTVWYPDTTADGMYINPASVFAPDVLGHHVGLTQVDGFNIQWMGTSRLLTSYGRSNYISNVITNLFGSLKCMQSGGDPVSVGENPNNALVYFLALRSENPFRSGAAKITFGITRKEKVELKVYDVAGRLVKTLANREFLAGEHKIQWDGSNDEGRLVPRGVYFYQLRTPSFVSIKRLVLLKYSF